MKQLLTALCLLAGLAASAQLPSVVSGKLIRHDSFPSRYVSPRKVDVWLPENYSPKKRYNVLYMHDGQMLFDSSITFNKMSWDVDDIATRLQQENKLQDLIVVGIWNSGMGRHADYFPQKPFESLGREQKDAVYAAARTNGVSVFNNYQIHSDDYLKFLVTELKPFIDKNYSTRTSRRYTFIAGSSMGGLISLYAICEYPDVFGGAACLSTHWPGIFTMDNNPFPDAMLRYVSAHLPDPKRHKIYFDCGDATLDAWYPPIQQKADIVMAKRGYTAKNWLTKYFPGQEHSEKAWRSRFAIPLTFLLGR